MLREPLRDLRFYAARIVCSRNERPQLHNRLAMCVSDKVIQALSDLPGQTCWFSAAGAGEIEIRVGF